MKERIFFGKTQEGETASRFVLKNSKGMCVETSDFGALVLGISFNDREGTMRDVALGFEQMEHYYQTDTGMGAYVGRNANRIKGASVNIEGVEYALDTNDGENNLHSGFNRSHCKLYASKEGVDENGQYVEFSRTSPHLEQGFPGNLEQKIRYTLTENNEFIIDYEMISDKTTVVNPTNHTYFNLDGHNSGTVLQHELEVYSDAYLETDKNLIPTGNIMKVSDTPMDFRNRKRVGKDIERDFLPLIIAKGYDHNYVFQNDRKLKKVAKLFAAQSGITMTVLSDLCGLQIYTGNYLNDEQGKSGAIYKEKSGICLETQFFPNACKEKRFPSSILKAGETFKSRTVYRFEVEV